MSNLDPLSPTSNIQSPGQVRCIKAVDGTIWMSFDDVVMATEAWAHEYRRKGGFEAAEALELFARTIVGSENPEMQS